MFKSHVPPGRGESKVDKNGRITIPSKWRRILAPEERDEVVVSLGNKKQLSIFKKEYWMDTIQQSYLELLEGAADQDEWDYIQQEIDDININSHISLVDSQGRITVPRRLLDSAGIKTEALVVGAIDRVNLWDNKIYSEWRNKKKESRPLSKPKRFFI